MRNGQNKQRMRGRNRGNRGPNPLSRSYESNGPDIKVRGTAQHVAEKYLQLARDAQASGDHIGAESLLQHAEHYFRIILAAQEQFKQQNPHLRPDQVMDEEGEDEEDDEPISGLDRRFESRPELYRQETPQQSFAPQAPQHNAPQSSGNQQRYDRNNRYERGPRLPQGDMANSEQPEVTGTMPGVEGIVEEAGQPIPRQPRPPRFDPRRDNRRDRFNGERGERPDRFADRQAPVMEESPAGLPAFITGGSPAAAPVAAPVPSPAEEDAQFPLRPVRRRRFTPKTDEATVAVDAPSGSTE